MATQLLIYESVVPVSSTRHAKHSVLASPDYGFARNVNSLPLTAVEFLQAAQVYPVVFTGAGNSIAPSAVLGLRDKQNAFLDADGAWSAGYIPAFARRYPFVFSSQDDGKNFTLCIDESFPGFNAADRGERLFDEQGKPTQYVENVLKFLQQYQLEFQRTQVLCNRLKELDLFEPMQAQVNLGEGAQISLSGFMAINRAKVKALPGETLAELVRNDTLELIYAHLHSMQHFTSIRERLVAVKPAAAGKPAVEESKSNKPAAEESKSNKPARAAAGNAAAGAKKR